MTRAHHEVDDEDLPDALAYVFDGAGNMRVASPAEFVESNPSGTDEGFGWLHMRLNSPGIHSHLEDCGVDSFVTEALMAPDTRPRCTIHGDGVLLNLRGVNLNPGAASDDMVSVRLWIEAHRVIGAWARPLRAIRDQVAAIKRNQAPVSPGDLVVKLARRLADLAEPSVAALNERIDDIEDLLLDPDADLSHGQLADIRRSAIVLRRYFIPQRDALTALELEDLPWLNNADRSHLREAADRVSRVGEELDAIRDRAQIVHDQIMDQRSERMNRQMLLLSVMAAIFLPLGLITGLLGINVIDIPGSNDPRTFTIVCGLLVFIAVALLLWFRRIGLFR